MLLLYIAIGWLVLSAIAAIATGKSIKHADRPDNLAKEAGSLG